jgi:Fe2+ or Zn2+ uptake regulation protein
MSEQTKEFNVLLTPERIRVLTIINQIKDTPVKLEYFMDKLENKHRGGVSRLLSDMRRLELIDWHKLSASHKRLYWIKNVPDIFTTVK